MFKGEIQKQISELETICQSYLLTDSKAYALMQKGSEEEYLRYLKGTISGIVHTSQSVYKDMMGSNYDKYIDALLTCLYGNKLTLNERQVIFKDISEGCLIGGFA